MRTSLQTLDAREMRCIWNERFDREMMGIFELQEEISRPQTRLAYAMIPEMICFEGPRDDARMDEALELALGSAREALLRARPGFSRAFAEERLVFIKSCRRLNAFLEGLARAGIRCAERKLCK